MSSKPNTCSHPGCRCSLDSEPVMRNGVAYCSERCADRRGCDHQGCNCGAFPEQRPGK